MNGELDDLTYAPGRVPLAEATIWPTSLSDREAGVLVAKIEEWGDSKIGGVRCEGGAHWMMGDPEPVPIEARFRCPACRAEL